MTILRIPIPGQPGLYREVDEATGEPVSFEVFDSPEGGSVLTPLTPIEPFPLHPRKRGTPSERP